MTKNKCRDLLRDVPPPEVSNIESWVERLTTTILECEENPDNCFKCCILCAKLSSFVVCHDALREGFNDICLSEKNLLHLAYRQNNYLLLHVLLNKGARITTLRPNYTSTRPYLQRYIEEPLTKQNVEMLEDYFISKLKPFFVSRKCRIRRLRLCHSLNDDGNVYLVVCVAGDVPPKVFYELHDTVRNGLKIIVHKTNSTESKVTQIRENENETYVKTLNLSPDCAATLFSEHSNLNLISVSAYKSIGFGTRRSSVLNNTCITLYCDHKGFIPILERHFPRKIKGFDTDIREGYCDFATNELSYGDTIKRSQIFKTGTLGGFVDLQNGHKGFLTCAHVLHSLRELKSRSCETDKEVFQVKDGNDYFIGRTEGAVFRTDKPSEVSVDAALVRIDDNTIPSGNFPYIRDYQRSFAGKFVWH